ncbi:thymidylate synthase [Natronomonas pharaonis DSM 2160]|uniref:Thymidylate synthase n=1 Tax=Natronomonas pharaonis (strain ATCC 35678 / DSM 2160 / CIP 103997 / JCM 8858 / NBRC 14720 / NCIMB 2260 / Gabara) TaxID=348780 RepID=A0A1U7EWT1_NATPD|nr:thymidylate synthase [Natronomonas pharaonis]CAI49553.1 thymidylate synthase [Natronomonas pharaonis DSM 2160]
MQQYHDLVSDVLAGGTHKPNRTGVDTIASFSHHYEVDLGAGFPLLTTKRMDGYRWNSLIHELLWYLSGEEHIRTLREETKIWDAWADDEGHLDTAYGRFWRRFPVPDEPARLPGESWPDDSHRWTTTETTPDGTERQVFDQLAYVLDTLEENPHSRRLVVNAWHPANAAVSTLPPCHYTFVFNVQGDQLNVHLTQRSGDIALGVPFNLAAYSLLAHAVANRTAFEVGSFGHTIVDAHIYCGAGDRGAWYADKLPALQDRLNDIDDREEYVDVREWLESEAPAEADDEGGLDHVPGLLTQLSRSPRDRPEIEVADRPLDDLEYDDVQLHDYDPAPGISFSVAE